MSWRDRMRGQFRHAAAVPRAKALEKAMSEMWKHEKKMQPIESKLQDRYGPHARIIPGLGGGARWLAVLILGEGTGPMEAIHNAEIQPAAFAFHAAKDALELHDQQAESATP